MDWWTLPNASSIMQICSAIHEILADKAFTATDGLIFQSFIITFVHPTYVWIVLIWSFPVQLSLWKSVHWLWRYKLNEVCDTLSKSILNHIEIWINHKNLEYFIMAKKTQPQTSIVAIVSDKIQFCSVSLLW